MLEQGNVFSPHKGLLSCEDGQAARVWSIFYAGHVKRMARYADFISSDYLRALGALGLRADHLPTVRELRAKLQPVGWDVAPVSGYLRGETLFGLLHEGRFPLSLPIRSEQFIDHSPMPDFIHDILGHLPLMLVESHRRFVRRFAERFLEAPPCPLEERLFEAQERLSTLVNMDADAGAVARAQRSVGAINEAIEQSPSRRSRLLKIWLWGVEFGFMHDGSSVPKVVGAGILSSKEELCWAITRRRLPLDRTNVMTTYDFTNPQQQYFSFRGWESLESLLIDN